jgi:hypothetical protein
MAERCTVVRVHAGNQVLAPGIVCLECEKKDVISLTDHEVEAILEEYIDNKKTRGKTSTLRAYTEDPHPKSHICLGPHTRFGRIKEPKYGLPILPKPRSGGGFLEATETT